jgi:MoxR-like ATPase
MNVEEKAAGFRAAFSELREEVGKVIVGGAGGGGAGEAVDAVLTCVFAGGHCLLEGAPGLGKTMLVRTLSEALDLRFSRIQFTPDLMPADIIGTNVLMRDEEGNQLIRFQKGPIFSQVLLADEINRATPKTQSALLEAMQEQNVTVAGQTYALTPPFIVLATQNPIEMEGTYPLPEAQLDRFFFKLKVEYPGYEDLLSIVERTTSGALPVLEQILAAPEIAEFQDLIRAVPASPAVLDYAVRLVYATHPDREKAIEEVRRFVRYGSSPRGAQSLILAAKVYALLDGRFTIDFDDVRRASLPSLRHRLILSFQGEAEGVDPDSIVRAVVESTPEATR